MRIIRAFLSRSCDPEQTLLELCPSSTSLLAGLPTWLSGNSDAGARTDGQAVNTDAQATDAPIATLTHFIGLCASKEADLLDADTIAHKQMKCFRLLLAKADNVQKLQIYLLLGTK